MEDLVVGGLVEWGDGLWVEAFRDLPSQTKQP